MIIRDHGHCYATLTRHLYCISQMWRAYALMCALRDMVRRGLQTWQNVAIWDLRDREELTDQLQCNQRGGHTFVSALIKTEALIFMGLDLRHCHVVRSDCGRIVHTYGSIPRRTFHDLECWNQWRWRYKYLSCNSLNWSYTSFIIDVNKNPINGYRSETH